MDQTRLVTLDNGYHLLHEKSMKDLLNCFAYMVALAEHMKLLIILKMA